MKTVFNNLTALALCALFHVSLADDLTMRELKSVITSDIFTGISPDGRKLQDLPPACDPVLAELSVCVSGLSASAVDECDNCLAATLEITDKDALSCGRVEDLCEDFKTCTVCGSCVGKAEEWFECLIREEVGCNINCGGSGTGNQGTRNQGTGSQGTQSSSVASGNTATTKALLAAVPLAFLMI